MFLMLKSKTPVAAALVESFGRWADSMVEAMAIEEAARAKRAKRVKRVIVRTVRMMWFDPAVEFATD